MAVSRGIRRLGTVARRVTPLETPAALGLSKERPPQPWASARTCSRDRTPPAAAKKYDMPVEDYEHYRTTDDHVLVRRGVPLLSAWGSKAISL
uniref:Uncharacterized protein n=1 Tax=Vombatus ursinus TaxID=29139 RepID=A0A4X2KT45_VOMUR